MAGIRLLTTQSDAYMNTQEFRKGDEILQRLTSKASVETIETRSSSSTQHTDRTDATSISSVASSAAMRLSMQPRSYNNTSSGCDGFDAWTTKNDGRSSLEVLSIDSQRADSELAVYLDQELHGYRCFMPLS